MTRKLDEMRDEILDLNDNLLTFQACYTDHNKGGPPCRPPFKNDDLLENVDPEVKSYICQVLMELEPYTTPETVITVTAKDPLN